MSDANTTAPLACVPCERLLDGKRVPGELVLHSERLRFQPDPTTDASPLAFSLRAVESVVVTPIKRRLMVQTALKAHWFAGPAAAALGERLAALRGEVPGYAPDERLLHQGTSWSGPIRGELVMTSRRLRFVARGILGALARLLHRPVDWEVPLDQVKSLAATPGGISLHTGGIVRRVLGPLSILIAAQLRAGGIGGTPTPLRHAALVRRRLSWSRMVLQLVEDKLLLLPSSGKATTLPLAELLTVAIGARRITLQLADQPPISLTLSTPGLLAQRILAVALELQCAATSERVTAAARWQDGLADLGVLTLTRTALHFQPRTGGHPFTIPVAEIRAVDAPPGRIRFTSPAGTICLQPSGGEHFVESFWDLCTPPDRVHPWPGSADHQVRVLADTRMTRIFAEGHDDILLQPGLAVPVDGGVGLAIPGDIAAPAPGTIVQVELGQANGVYQFSAELLRIEPLPPEIQVPRDGQMLVLSSPDELRFYNQRSAYRVAMRMRISAWRLRADPGRQSWVPDGDRIEGELLNLSISGCALQTTAEIPVGARVFLELLVGDHWLPLEAECVRSGPGWPSNHRRLGVRFLNVPERLEQILNQTVTQQQRAQT